MNFQDNIFRLPNINEIQIVDDVSMKELESEEVQGAEISPLHPRIGFLRKLYSLLFVSLLLVILIASFFVYSCKFTFFKNLLILTVSLILIIGTTIFIFLKKMFLMNPNKNFLIFSIYYLEIMIAFSCMICLDDSKAILMIVIEADGILLFLSIYSLITQNVLTYQVATLFVLAPIFIVFNIFLLFSSISLECLIFLSMAGVIWGFYLIYETQTIMKGPKIDVEKMDIFIESITIYADLFLLFLRNSELIKDIMITRKSSKMGNNFSNNIG